MERGGSTQKGMSGEINRKVGMESIPRSDIEVGLDQTGSQIESRYHREGCHYLNIRIGFVGRLRRGRLRFFRLFPAVASHAGMVALAMALAATGSRLFLRGVMATGVSFLDLDRLRILARTSHTSTGRSETAEGQAQNEKEGDPFSHVRKDSRRTEGNQV